MRVRYERGTVLSFECSWVVTQPVEPMRKRVAQASERPGYEKYDGGDPLGRQDRKRTIADGPIPIVERQKRDLTAAMLRHELPKVDEPVAHAP